MRLRLRCGAGERTPAAEAPEAAPLVGDKNLINESTIIGKQEKYEASNITIHNNITEDHSHTTIVCAVSGKRIYLDHSVVCPKCGKQVALNIMSRRRSAARTASSRRVRSTVRSSCGRRGPGRSMRRASSSWMPKRSGCR
ncbi:MAG: hypothetical protein ACLT1W_02700 [Alistipes onderdonkii]